MTKTELRDLIQRACNELIPRGVEHAWDHVDGSALKWSDLLALATEAVTLETPAPVEPKGKTKAVIVVDEASNGTV